MPLFPSGMETLRRPIDCAPQKTRRSAHAKRATAGDRIALLCCLSLLLASCSSAAHAHPPPPTPPPPHRLAAPHSPPLPVLPPFARNPLALSSPINLRRMRWATR